MTEITSETRRTTATRPCGPIDALLRLFSSVWLGIALLVLLFVYSSIGSAVPLVRQHPWFDMTEMEWFNAWPFRVLTALLCLNIVVVTVRRIPFRLAKAGVLTAHLGVLVLCLGSLYYFGTKVEGDTPVFRRQAVIRIPDRREELHLLIRPGNHIMALADEGEFRFTVQDIRPHWPILTGEDRGKSAYAVFVGVQTPSDRFTRLLLDGYPSYTEDILADGTRAVKGLGTALVNDAIDIRLAVEPQDFFYLVNTAALYVRRAGDAAWTERPIPRCPHYHSRLGSLGDVWVAPDGTPPELNAINDAVPAATSDDPLADVDIRVTGYLRYARDRVRWVDGGHRLNPLVRVRLRRGEDPPRALELLALQEDRREDSEGSIRFEWVESADELAALAAGKGSRLDVFVPRQRVTQTIPVSPDTYASLNPSVPFQVIDGTDYAVRVRNCADELRMPDGRVMAVAIVEIRAPQGTVTRMVASDPTASRDLVDADRHAFAEPDPGIEIRYHPSQLAPITVVAGPDPIGVSVLQATESEVLRWAAEVGAPVDLGAAGTLTIEQLLERARPELRPEIVPEYRRDRDARNTFSQLRITLSQGDWQRSAWLPFNAYALPNGQYAVPDRIAHLTRQVELPDGQRVELMFSRQREPLGGRVALDDFMLKTHRGGYTGAMSSIRDFVSRLRFSRSASDDDWSEPVALAVNHPVTFGSLSLFQAQWDPPTASSAGLNYAGLGVGSRQGVYIQLAGAVMMIAGMIFAFYVKPGVLRRRRRAAAVEPGADRPEPAASTVTGRSPERRLGVLVGVIVLSLTIYLVAGRSRPAPAAAGFAAAVDLTPLARVAVQDAGRLESFDSYARTTIRRIGGPRGIAGQSASFTYLDMVLRPHRYTDADVIYVKYKAVRARIALALTGVPEFDPWCRERFLETGLISPRLLRHPRAARVVDTMAQDVLRTAKAIDQIRTALFSADPQVLSDGLRVIPPPGAGADASWLPGSMVWGSTDQAIGVPGLDADLRDSIRDAWQSLGDAWRNEDAVAASTVVATLAALLPQIEPGVYPPLEKLAWESWYFRYKALVWTWIVYLLAAVPLLTAVIYRWPAARTTGLVLFVIAFGLHTASLAIRWYLSGRIPNSNMYEAITASTWFGAAAALVLELAARHRPVRSLFALGASICAAAAMMCSHFMPVQLNADIENIMPVLHDVWLYIHTNVVIFSYCLIGMGSVSALLYLLYRLVGGPSDYAQAGGIGTLTRGASPDSPASGPRFGQILDGATMVLMEFATVLLWTGIVMGAVWADHSWGRPWGWDPKEVFALNTLVIFLLLLHVRLTVRDKGLWTATLACTGCVVMLFNWIVINFIITGLHSYA